jgi:serine protease inhibitor
MKNDQGVGIFVSKIDQDNIETIFDLFHVVKSLSMSTVPLEHDYTNVYCPMISLKVKGAVSWLKDARTFSKEGLPYYIRVAKSEHILRLNETGTLAKAAVAAEILWLSAPIASNPYVINGPFVIWYEVDGVILFCAKIEEDAMRRPVGLDG